MKKYSFILIILVCAFIILIQSSCTTSKSTNLLQQKGPVYTPTPFRDYKLQYNDAIFCSILTSNKDFSDVFNGIITKDIQSNNSITYPVYETGNISIPFFGDIPIVGLTIPQAEDAIQKKMRLAIPDAQVKITLANNYYYVVSDNQNGRYGIYKDNMTIYQALAVMGEPNKRMDYNNVKIIRTDLNGKAIVKSFDLKTESLIESEFYYLKPNDMIYYSTSKRAFFQIESFTGAISTIMAPITVAIAIWALADNY